MSTVDNETLRKHMLEIGQLTTVNGHDTIQPPILTSLPHPSTEGVAVKHDDGKVDWSLIPIEAMEEILRVFEFGAKKYERFNFRKGFKQSRLLSAAFRHLTAHMRGEDIDPESGFRHLAHAGCCVLMLLTNIFEGKDEDDRYKG